MRLIDENTRRIIIPGDSLYDQIGHEWLFSHIYQYPTINDVGLIMVTDTDNNGSPIPDGMRVMFPAVFGCEIVG